MIGRILLALGVLAVVGFAWLWFAPCGFGGCAPVSELERFQAEGSELLDVNGEPFATLATVNRRIVPLDSLPEHVPRAFLAVEDRRFFEHSGVDWKRLGGALVSNVKAGGVAEGGSTISMQLARNLFPDHLPYRERSIRRKLMEVRVARQIERAFPKDKILELYLNHIYLGEGAYGVEAAALEYFGKSASELTVAEAAVLGGLPKAPSQINPREDREAARARRDLVLGEMAKAGYISAEEAEEARAGDIRLARSRRGGAAERGAYFTARVRRELERHVGPRFYTAGLRVHTTYDPRAQAAAEEELAKQLDAVEAGQFGSYRHPTYPEAKGDTEDGVTPYLQGAVILMDATTGEVRALVGGRDYDDSKFDRAMQAVRQPGSLFKPFVYLTALEEGIPPTHRVEDAPVRMVLTGGRVWEPKNYTGRYDGPMTLREALTRSKNAVTVRLAEEVGMSDVIRNAQTLGITSDISPLPSTALGASEVRPVELAQAYAAFASLGARVEPHFIRRVETRDGELVWETPTQAEEVLDPAAAFVLTTMLEDVVNRGTGTPARAAGYRGPAAGKTGTTNGSTDVWFAGYTPELVGIVWMGLDKPKTIVRGASGGSIAAPVWGRIMARVYSGRPAPRPWPRPRGVVVEEVDRATGLAVDADCPGQGATYTEYFINSLPPRQPCYSSTYTYAGFDTAWVDEEWNAKMEPWTADGDTLAAGEVAPGIVWPELEEMRAERRGGRADSAPRPPTGAAGTRPREARTPPAPAPPTP
ncbi:MAG TPA: PBP1A family penicillin-binding protein, partial [Longimicrobiaceae bacterium]|nr:PBP1A family penicillin-binding protein [Longimicrobiaceae bacterium]